MKVVEKGNEKGNWSKEVVCTGEGYEEKNGESLKIPCGAKLKINISDIEVSSHYTGSFYDSWEEYEYYCTCPECGSKTRLTDLDSYAINYAKAAYKKAKESSKALNH